MPVRSRCIWGTCQFRIKRSPPLPICSTGVSGMPASRRASKPAATANCVLMSHARMAFGSIPNSSARSKAPLRPANCGMSPNTLAWSMFTEPSRPLMRRTMFLSRRRCLYSSETSLMQVSPRTSFSKASSENTRSIPGKPSEIPVTTYGSTSRREVAWRAPTVCIGAVLNDEGAETVAMGVHEEGGARTQRLRSPAVTAADPSNSGSI